MNYSFRSSLIDSEKTYRLTADGLTISAEGGRTESVPYADIDAVNLQYNGTMNEVSRYRCVIRAKGRKIALTNAHYVSLGNFETRDDEYSRFVAGLHERLQPYADRIRFTQGSMVLFISALLFAIVMPPMIAVALYLVIVQGENLTFSARNALFVTPALLAFVMIPVLRKGRRRPYNGKDLPEDFLPSIPLRPVWTSGERPV